MVCINSKTLFDASNYICNIEGHKKKKESSQNRNMNFISMGYWANDIIDKLHQGWPLHLSRNWGKYVQTLSVGLMRPAQGSVQLLCS